MSNFDNKIRVADLRIGNILVYPNYYKKGSDRIWFVRDIYFDGDTIGLTDRRVQTQVDIKDLRYIPLTEDWLLKLGFSSEEYRDKSKHIGINFGQTDFTLVKPGSSGFEHIKHFGFEFDAGGWPRLKQFEYVHELQNFFYCYSGEELEVKI